MESIATCARGLARYAHAGQTDKAGRDYFDTHLRAVAAALIPFGPRAEAVGWLHDILEDTATTTADLLENDVELCVVTTVQALTRDPDVPYQQWIEGMGEHARTHRLMTVPSWSHPGCEIPVALLAKLADNANNAAPHRLALLDDARARSLGTRYRRARSALLAAIADEDAAAAVITAAAAPPAAAQGTATAPSASSSR